MGKFKEDATNAILFTVLLPAIIFAAVKTMLRVRKEMTMPNPEMWE